MQHRLLLLVLLCSLGVVARRPSAAAATVPGRNLPAREATVGSVSAADSEGFEAAEVDALASESYRRREVARARLLRGGEAARAALAAGLESPDLEVRTASRELLRRLAESEQERQIARLLSGSSEAEAIDLPGWKLFSEAVGDAPPHRTLFVRIVRSHAPSLAWLDQLGELDGARSHNAILSEMNSFLPIEISGLSQGDPDQWGLLLLAASQPELRAAPVLSSRLRGSLLNPAVAERLLASPHQTTLRRLIAHWLELSSKRYINESMLKISLAYECGEIATRLAMKTMDSRQATPASLVAAMTLLARLEPDLARRELPRVIDDVRVWHVVVTRHGPIRSQVSDVALALLLYLDNRDPREVGFDALEADPRTIFRDYSLGFDDESQRRRAHERAQQLLDLNSVGGSHDVFTEDE